MSKEDAPIATHCAADTTGHDDDIVAHRRWPNRLGFVVVSVGAALLIVSNRSDVVAIWHALAAARWPWLLVALACAAGWTVNQAAFHAAARRSVGVTADWLSLWPVALSGTFLNLAAKSGGMAGLAAFTRDARRRNVPIGGATAAYLLVNVLGEVAFAVTLVVAMIALAFTHGVSSTEIAALGVFAIYLALRIAVFAAALRSRRAIRTLYALPGRVWRRLRHRDAPAGPTTLQPPTLQPTTLQPTTLQPTTSHAAADELFDAMALLRAGSPAVWRAAAHALLVEVLGVAMLSSALLAVGVRGGPTLALTTYSVSVLFSIVSILPAGLGFVEVSMVALLVTFGASSTTAAAAVALYRALELWLPLIVGGLATVQLRRGIPVPSSPATATATAAR